MITLELLHNVVTEELQNLFFNRLKNLCKPLRGAEGEGSVLKSAHLAPGQPSDATIRADGADAVCQVSSTGGRLEMKTHREARGQTFPKIYVREGMEIAFSADSMGEMSERPHDAAAFPPCHLPFKLIVIV